MIDNDGAVVRISVSEPDSARAQQALRAYYTDIVARYYDRPVTDAEIDEVLVDESSDDLRPPTGLFWVATLGEQVVGCVGLRYITRPASASR